MVVLTAEVVHNRLQDIKTPTQEAIETMSLWIMHYKDKASIDVIVQGWQDCFKSGSESRRIALFYVMNDVVQKAKMKHADTLIPAFQPAVLNSVNIGRKHEKVRDVMKRCVQIFKSRNVFSADSIKAMENLLDSDEGADTEDQILEVDSDELFKKITHFVTARNIIGDMMKTVNEGDFDYKEKCRTGMRDREEGAHILQEVHEAIDTMVQVRHSMENQKKKMMALSETLELAKRVFLHQKREVLVVEEAYINFRDGIKAVHTDLLEMQSKGVYPGILSPTNDEDHYGAGGIGDGYRQSSSSWADNNAPMDMDMDDEERPQAPMMKPSLQALVGIASQPSLQSRIMQLGLKKIADGDEDMFLSSAPTAPNPPPPPSTNSVMTNDFTRPPPIFGAAATAGAQPVVPSLPSDPRKRPEADGNGLSQYALAFQQQPLPQAAQNSRSVPPPQAPAVATAYQGHFEARDPRLAATAPQPPAVSAYRSQFEQRDPRLQQVPPPLAPVQTGGYQASFDVSQQAAPLISPQAQTGGYQARFDPKPMSSGMQMSPAMPQTNQYQSYQRPPPPQQQQQQGYGDYHASAGGQQDHKDTNQYNRGPGGGGFNRNGGGGGYHQNSAPYSNPRSSGGQDRWRGGGGGGGYGDRNGRNNWRGNSNRGGGGYNRY